MLGSQLDFETDPEFEITGAAIAPGADAAAVAYVAALAETLCQPGGGRLAAAELTAIRVTCAPRNVSADDLNAAVGLIAERIADFPADVIRAACREWRDRERFFPTQAELVRSCEARMRMRLALREACARWRPAPPPEPPRQPVTPEDRAAVNALIRKHLDRSPGPRERPVVGEHGGPPKDPDQVKRELAEYGRRFRQLTEEGYGSELDEPEHPDEPGKEGGA